MKIISHRGCWRSPVEKNSKDALVRSFELGFGTETDLRDVLREIRISHDPPRGDELSFKELLEIYSRFDTKLSLALNVKADGLQKMAADLLQHYSITEYFFFDMSIPDMIGYHKAGLRFFTRRSEIEQEPSMLAESAGVWMDLFYSDWITESEVAPYLKQGKQVCLVSPDLHKRDHQPFWENILKWDCLHDDRLMLCTDLPEDARTLLANINYTKK
jgi:hypothetical protein